MLNRDVLGRGARDRLLVLAPALRLRRSRTGRVETRSGAKAGKGRNSSRSGSKQAKCPGHLEEGYLNTDHLSAGDAAGESPLIDLRPSFEMIEQAAGAGRPMRRSRRPGKVL